MKRSNQVATIILTALFALFIVSCGGTDTTDEKNDDETTNDADTEEVMDEEAQDTETSDNDTIVDITTLDYPTPTGSSATGDIIRNIIFHDELDRERAFAEWYRSNNPGSKLIWLVVSTYDCGYCVLEKKDLPKLNKKEYRDRGFSLILIMNGLLSGPQPSKEPGKISNLREDNLEAYGEGADYLYGYLKTQEEYRQLGLLGYPQNILIDANTMEILDVFSGWDSSLVDHYHTAINFFLDEL
jgi:hypothetical protein